MNNSQFLNLTMILSGVSFVAGCAAIKDLKEVSQNLEQTVASK